MTAPSPGGSDAMWERVVATLSSQGVTARDRAFLRLTRLLGVLDSTVLLAVPYQHTKETLETSLRQPIVDAIAAELGHDVRLAITVDEDLRREVEDEGDPPVPAETDVTEAPAPTPGRTSYRSDDGGGSGAVQTASAEDARLTPKYTFDTFVSGSSHRFAHAASLAVAESPARAYNPLFIYGESGLGKTHLLHAIGHYARNLYPGVRVRYVNSEEFTNDFINSIRDDKAGAFQRRYRNVDFLLVDDIQFLQGKEQTVEEFFHTFNTLHNSEKQVVITSDQPPKRLSGFAERMRSRFEWGLLTDVQPPDLETRIAILKKKAAQEGMQLPDEVLELIGSKISTNIRELEGALIRVTAFASLSSTPPDAALAAHVLKDIIPSSESAAITVPTIMAEVSDYFQISHDELCGTSRSRTLVNA
ncbi:chromosomal replication initiator protein DnaA, partial [Actinosynnema sp.]|uniref:chromosomal replication initiator protein DnaA n=1 Tax=Actinosynnema sp. TaxID=1872144 RepID=UPI003F846B17